MVSWNDNSRQQIYECRAEQNRTGGRSCKRKCVITGIIPSKSHKNKIVISAVFLVIKGVSGRASGSPKVKKIQTIAMHLELDTLGKKSLISYSLSTPMVSVIPWTTLFHIKHYTCLFRFAFAHGQVIEHLPVENLIQYFGRKTINKNFLQKYKKAWWDCITREYWCIQRSKMRTNNSYINYSK